MWMVGLALTAMVVVDYGPGMIATGAIVMALYIPWAAFVGWKLAAGARGRERSGGRLREKKHEPWLTFDFRL